jgi:phosphoglycolate phosphatase-like HAD superfamily hydrolase
MIKLVIIDFDDTLSLTEEAFFHIENHIAREMGCAAMTRNAHQKNWGVPIQKAIVERIPGINPDVFLQKLGESLPEFAASGKVDGITDINIETLKKLKNKEKHLAILTSRTIKEIKHLLDENHHINRWIEKIYHADNSDYLKPDPRSFRQCLVDFKIAPNEAVYIGDSVSDGISAKGAGLHFIASLESGLRSKEDFRSVSVDFFANSFSEINDYII